jgi:predicted flap endonuclease-1-like 5' DNA nuclease
MAWLAEYPDSKMMRDQAEKALRIPLGMASPLWLAFGAVASAGVGWWWVNQWTKAANLEAMVAPIAKSPVLALVKETPEIVAEAVAEPVVEAPVAAAEIVEEVVAETAPEPVAYVAPAPAEPDDLTQLVGIGPKLADALAARGVTQFAQVAAWTAEDLARFDHELNLRGRAIRNAWVAQAKDMAAS